MTKKENDAVVATKIVTRAIAEVPGFEALLHRFKRSISVLGRSQRTFESYSRNIATIVYCSIAIRFQNTFCRSTSHSWSATGNNRLVFIFQFKKIIMQCIHGNIQGIFNVSCQIFCFATYINDNNSVFVLILNNSLWRQAQFFLSVFIILHGRFMVVILT